MRVSAGIITCNEERTIGPLLERIASERGDAFGVAEIIVVSAACQDRTDAIVHQFAERDPRVHLISEPERRGKSVAVNTFLAARGESDLTLLTSGDVLPEVGFLTAFAAAFDDPLIGMAGGRPVPVNACQGLTGRMAGLMWLLHHQIALENPKLGETVIFRSELVAGIPEDSPVDEASLEAIIREKGRHLCYRPEVIIHNRGPDTLGEWLSQRRRIACGHAWLRKTSGHRVSTGDPGHILGLLGRRLLHHPGDFPIAVLLVACEVLARRGAKRDMRSQRDHRIWEIARSTKSLSSG